VKHSFLVCGLPRSRLTWLARFLSVPHQSVCLCEGLARATSAEAFWTMAEDLCKVGEQPRQTGQGFTPAVMKLASGSNPSSLPRSSLPSGRSTASFVNPFSSGCGSIKTQRMWCGKVVELL